MPYILFLRPVRVHEVKPMFRETHLVGGCNPSQKYARHVISTNHPFTVRMGFV